MIALKEPYSRCDASPDPSQLPELARAIMAQSPGVFAPPPPTSTSQTTSATTMTNHSDETDHVPDASSPQAPHAPVGQDAGPSGGVEAPPSPAQAQGAPEVPQGEAGSSGFKELKIVLGRVDDPSRSSPSVSRETPTPSTSGGQGPRGVQPGESLRKKIISVGKQPKAATGRKKKDMVSELFDSLTPDAKYFDQTSRRRRHQPKTYDESEYDKSGLHDSLSSAAVPGDEMDGGRTTPDSVGGAVTESRYSSTSTLKKGRKRNREDSETSYRGDEMERPLTPT